MIRHPATPLAPAARAGLQSFQSEIDGLPDYAARVDAAKERFPKRNTASNATFREVRKTLARMCSGARRCMYCEDSVADEVEHVRPKDLYPEAVFVWGNFLYACGPCNGGKRNKFVVLVPPANVIDVTRQQGSPVVPPVAGTPMFIDPRTEDGLLYMQLDLTGTFRFVPTSALNTGDYARAEHTIRILKLNDRDYLVAARKEAYGSYVARLDQYATWSEAGKTPVQLTRLRNSLFRMGHPTVWAEMKRQHRRLKQLRSLFERIPEALTWRVP
jgi:uncharacterized protein (TIGR02646 family)